MKMMRNAMMVALCGAVGMFGCNEDPATPAFEGPGVRLNVGALNLPGIVNAEYTITITNGASPAETVWSDTVSADQFGDGAGSISYVAPCDAQDNDNTISLTLDRLVGTTGDLVHGVDFTNPTASGPLTRTFTCLENEDVFVQFDLAIARAANQGFFDVAVSFDDIFCSAKLDCLEDDGSEIELLHDGGTRARTVVMGFACTGRLPGQDGATTLYYDDITITCDGPTTTTVNPSGGPGNLVEGTDYIDGADTLFGAAVYRGEEDLGFNKAYWNVALGVDNPVAAPNCNLSARATAADGIFTGGATPPNTSYPYVQFNATLTNGAGGLACNQHELGSTEVSIVYTDSETPVVFTYPFLTNPPTESLWDQAIWGTSLWGP